MVMRAYTVEAHASDPTRLPNIEVFNIPDDYKYMENETGKLVGPGIYFWYVTDKEVPDSYPMGPYESIEVALEEARVGASDEP